MFEYACRADTFALAANPVRGAEKRREAYTKPPDTFTAEQILALARAARQGRHVNGGRRWASAERDVEQDRANAQDAALYTVAGFTGLRQGELRALRWKHVRFADRTIVIVAGMSAGEDSSTKSGKWRAVPLPREAFVVLGTSSAGASGSPARRTTSSAGLRVVHLTTRRSGAATTLHAMRRVLPPLPFHHLRPHMSRRSCSAGLRSGDCAVASGPLEDHDDRALPTRTAAHASSPSGSDSIFQVSA